MNGILNDRVNIQVNFCEADAWYNDLYDLYRLRT
jgi:hypothetical protein